MMKTTDENYKALMVAAEKAVGRKMCTPRDFDFLAMRIFDSTHSYMSPTTLKRFWGYLNISKTYKPRKSTLDLLSIFVGYKEYEAFCSQSSANEDEESDYVKSPNLYTTSIQVGNIVKLIWNPDRCVKIKFMGDDMFEVVDSVNSKLLVGDRFCCSCFINNEPLYLTRLVRDGKVLGAYVCGQKGGIKFLLDNSVSNPGHDDAQGIIGGVINCLTDDYKLCLDSLKTHIHEVWGLTG